MLGASLLFFLASTLEGLLRHCDYGVQVAQLSLVENKVGFEGHFMQF